MCRFRNDEHADLWPVSHNLIHQGYFSWDAAGSEQQVDRALKTSGQRDCLIPVRRGENEITLSSESAVQQVAGEYVAIREKNRLTSCRRS